MRKTLKMILKVQYSACIHMPLKCLYVPATLLAVTGGKKKKDTQLHCQ